MTDDAVKKSCPIINKGIIDCNEYCHFYNSNTRQCVVFDISENLKDIPKALSFLSLELRQPKRPIVEFIDSGCFIAEIRNDKECIYRNIVRGYILRAEPPKRGHLIIRFDVIASYIASDQIIRLKETYASYENAASALDAIKEACIEELLEFRSGRMKID